MEIVSCRHGERTHVFWSANVFSITAYRRWILIPNASVNLSVPVPTTDSALTSSDLQVALSWGACRSTLDVFFRRRLEQARSVGYGLSTK